MRALPALARRVSVLPAPAARMVIEEIAPSGINGLPVWEQSGAFLLTLGAVLGGATLLIAGGTAVTRALPRGLTRTLTSTWPLLGLVYLAAGATHFTYHGAYEAIVPPTGTWGLWQLPGSPEFHVAWTGVAEILGGAGLLGGAVAERLALRPLGWVRQSAALGLFTLTLAVTPANIYMFTHGAMMEGLPGPASAGPIPVSAHAVRLGLQCVLLGMLWQQAATPAPLGELPSSRGPAQE